MSHPKKATLILVRGLPGSGKTYFANQLAAAIGSGSVVLLDPDAIDYESEAYRLHSIGQLSEGVDKKLLPYRFLRSKAYLGIENGKTIIWNQPFTDLEIFQKMINRLQDYAERQSVALDIKIIEVNTPVHLALKRVKDRISKGGHGPSDDTFARFERDYTTAAPLGYQVIELDGTADIQNLVQQTVDALS